MKYVLKYVTKSLKIRDDISSMVSNYLRENGLNLPEASSEITRDDFTSPSYEELEAFRFGKGLPDEELLNYTKEVK